MYLILNLLSPQQDTNDPSNLFTLVFERTSKLNFSFQHKKLPDHIKDAISNVENHSNVDG
jgi:hypothetical protein